MKEPPFLRAHLVAQWLRPESALWDAIASRHIACVPVLPPSLDLGCGNGMFSFVTAGGEFSLDYDVYVPVRSTRGFWSDRDIYDARATPHARTHRLVAVPPRRRFSVGLDHKRNLLDQARPLGVYEELRLHDANRPLPFPDGVFRTVFSNILYWLDSPPESLREVARVLRPGGRAILCLPNRLFLRHCVSYRWSAETGVLRSLWKRLNRGRADSMRWFVTRRGLARLANRAGLEMVEHRTYLSALTLRFWDVGLRPLSPVLIRMANSFSPQTRRSLKREWIETVLPLLAPLYALEMANRAEGGFHLAVLERRGSGI